MTLRLRSDAAVGQAIEAMMIGTLVIGAVGFAVAFQAPPPPSANAGSENLASETWDAVDALNHMKYPDSSFGNRTLSKVVADAAGGNPGPLVDSLEAFMPTGSAFQVYLNNGFDQIPLYENRTPRGQTVGVAYPFEPNWKYHYGSTDLRVYNANSSLPALGAVLAPLFNSNHVEDEGQYMRVRYAGEQGWLPGRDITFDRETVEEGAFSENSSLDNIQKPFFEDAYTSLVQGNDSVSYSSASIYMRCDRSPEPQPCFGIDLREQNLSGYAPMGKDNVEKANATIEPPDDTTQAPDVSVDQSITWHRIDVVVDNEGPGEVPAGAKVEVRYPVGLPVKKNVTSPGGEIENISYQGSYPDPVTVIGTVASGGIPAGEVAELRTWVARTDDRFAYKRIDASLANGTVSSSQFVAIVAQKGWGPETGGDTRVALISGPKPAGSIASDGTLPQGRWGMVLLTPVGPPDVQYMNLTITQGEGRFVNVSYPDDFDPTYSGIGTDSEPMDAGKLTMVEDKINWTGEHRPDGYTFAELQLEITTDGNMSAASPEFPLAKPQARFTDYTPPPQAVQIEPGLWWREYPPASTPHPGYGAGAADTSEDSPLDNRTGEVKLTHRNQMLEGPLPYKLADLKGDASQGAVKDAVAGSYLAVDPQRVVPGGEVEFHLNADDLATYLSEQFGVNSLTMQTHIYPPWGVRNRTPIETIDHRSAAGTLQAPTVLMPAYLDDRGGQDVLVGSTDGNVYGLEGIDGEPIAGRTFSLPKGQEDTTDPSTPNLLTRSRNGIDFIYGVGTRSGLSEWYSFDDEMNERWAAPKPGGNVRTIALNTSLDLTGDGVPEFIASHSTGEDTSTGASTIEVFNGLDTDGDGQADRLPGWSEVNLTGISDQVGMARVGAPASPGVFANPGLEVSASIEYNVNTTVKALEDGDLESAQNMSIAAGISGSGLVGFYEDARRAWNFSGGDFVDVIPTEKIDTGGDWSAMLGPDATGWVYAFNGSQPIKPVDGWWIPNVGGISDLSMANRYEGYFASPDGQMFATDDGWTTLDHYENPAASSAVPELAYPGIQTVDTPDGDLYQGYGNISWWAGKAGILLRSTDRIATVEELTTTGELVGVVSLRSTENSLESTLEGATTIDLTKIDFRDVLAESRDEAWFVGEGASGTTLDDYGYIVHTLDGGDTMRVTQIKCYDNDTLLSGCGLNGISDDGEHLWVVGDYGTVLVNDRGGQAGDVDLVDSPGVNVNGILPIELSASSPVEIKNASVAWDPFLKLDWMRSITLHDTSQTLDLWNKSEGGPHVVDPVPSTSDNEDYDQEKGVAHDGHLLVKNYTTSVAGSQDSDRAFDDTAYLKIGPFRPDLDPYPLEEEDYYKQSWYEDSTNLPLTFIVNVTYEDETTESYEVTLEKDGSVTTRELHNMGWIRPNATEFSFPAHCFGLPEEGCKPYHGINTTRAHPDGLTGAIVGEPTGGPTTSVGQAPLVRMAPGSQAWEPQWNISVNVTYRDAAINLEDPDRWVLVGDDSRVMASYNGGENFTDLFQVAAASLGGVDHLHAVDYTNPDTATIAGGSGQAVLWSLDGYREWGRAQTHPLTRQAGSSPDPMTNLTIDTSQVFVSDTNVGNALVRVEVWDNGTDGWVTVHDPLDGWENVSREGGEENRTLANGTLVRYDYAGPTEDLELRTTLRAGASLRGFPRWSPMLRGQMIFDATTEPDGPHNVTYHLDLNDTAPWEDLSQMDHSDEHGYLRLPSAQNFWVKKMGNPYAGDWSKVRSNNTAPEITASDVSPDGHTLFVGTGPINDLTTGDQVSTGDGPAYDNTLYEMNVTTGKILDRYHFIYPVEKIDASNGVVYVMTREPDGSSTNPDTEIHRFDWPPLTHTGKTDPVGSAVETRLMAAVDAFPDTGGVDVIYGYKDAVTESGAVAAYPAPELNPIGWIQVPSFKGNLKFLYEVPRNGMYGAYLTVTEIEWTITEEHGNDIVQTARIHNSFSVTPPNKRIPLSPTYNLDVVAWMEDWR